MTTRRCTIPALLALLALALAGCGSGGTDTAPVADAGEDVTVRSGVTVVLDGSGSSDADGDELDYSWSMVTAPDGSDPELERAGTAEASFRANVAGEYQLRLEVSDGSAVATDAVAITVVANAAPNADAGADTVVAPGAAVELDASGSSDPDGDHLSYAWSFLSRPTDSAAALDDAGSRTPRFTADEPGTYEVRLVVSDGGHEAVDVVRVEANQSPEARAGDDREVPVGEIAILDGGASTDPDGIVRRHAWSFIHLPVGSTAVLNDADAASASFEVDVEGSYVLELTVDDGHEVDRDRVTITGTPASGVTGSTIYVASDGSDGNPGTESLPLATVGAALAEADANAAIERVRLGPGTYAETFDATIERDLAIIGPDAGAGTAVLDAGPNDLFTLRADATVTLLRTTLRSGGVAVDVGTDASVTLRSVVCEAVECVVSPRSISDSGGRVTIGASTIRGAETGVQVLAGEGLTVTDSVVEGASGDGIQILATPTYIARTDIDDNDTGLRATWLAGTDTVLVEDSSFAGNGSGVFAALAQGVTLRRTTVTSTDRIGIEIQASSVVTLRGVTVSGSGGDGIAVGTGTSGEASVTLRETTVEWNKGDGLLIEGAGTNANLGTSTDQGQNTLSRNGAYDFNDARPTDASGLVVMSDTWIGRTAGPFEHQNGPIAADGLRIANDNVVYVY